MTSRGLLLVEGFCIALSLCSQLCAKIVSHNCAAEDVTIFVCHAYCCCCCCCCCSVLSVCLIISSRQLFSNWHTYRHHYQLPPLSFVMSLRTGFSLFQLTNQLVNFYTVSRKKNGPPKQKAVTCTIYNTMQ